MAILRRVGRVVKKTADVRTWIGFDYIKDLSVTLYSVSKKLFVLQNAEYQESFAEAMQRLKLSEADIQEKQTEFLRMAIVFLILSLIIFIYDIYLLVHLHIAGGVIGFVVTCVSLAMAFRYHFWFFQIKNRKLGCTLSEWYNSTTTTRES